MSIRAYGGTFASLSTARNIKRINKLPRLQAVPAAASEFYGSSDASFDSLGLEPEIVDALKRAGFNRPARVQEDTAEVLLTGRNAVIASETGSGKTLAYMAPISSLLLRQKQQLANSEKPYQFHALILCPNLILCQQVLSVINFMKDQEGKPLLSAAIVNSSKPPPFEAPDIILATPAGLMSFLTQASGTYGRLWTEEGLQGRVLHVILDEADLLLGDAYRRAVDRVLQMFKTADRRRVEVKVFEELNMSAENFVRLPAEIRQAAWLGGVPAMFKAGYSPKRHKRTKQVPVEEEQEEGQDVLSSDSTAQQVQHDVPAASTDGVQVTGAANASSTTESKPDGPRQYGPYWRRQYVFVAATMPTATKADVGTEIERFFPDAVWISSEALHTSKAKVQHTWHQVDEGNWRKQLLHVLTQDPDYQAGKAKTLIFAQNVEAVEAVSAGLTKNGIEHYKFHKKMAMSEPELAVAAMQQAGHGVMVCTDAAARGLDIQDISHVIQADFAPNTIDFIHRIGRTGRADRAGKVTSLYREHDVALVDVIRDYMDQGKPLEAAFSRARSFKRKLKRMDGKFVPRGMKSEDYESAVQDGSQSKEEPAAA